MIASAHDIIITNTGDSFKITSSPLHVIACCRIYKNYAPTCTLTLQKYTNSTPQSILSLCVYVRRLHQRIVTLLWNLISRYVHCLALLTVCIFYYCIPTVHSSWNSFPVIYHIYAKVWKGYLHIYLAAYWVTWKVLTFQKNQCLTYHKKYYQYYKNCPQGHLSN